jgi:hypothetical protein
VIQDDQGQQGVNPWAKAFPYSNEPGSQFSVGSLAPQGASMYAPTGQQQTAAPQAGGVPQFQFGGDQQGEDAGEESKQFASNIGQGVLASSQAGAKKKSGMGGMGGMSGGGGSGGFGMA